MATFNVEILQKNKTLMRIGDADIRISETPSALQDQKFIHVAFCFRLREINATNILDATKEIYRCMSKNDVFKIYCGVEILFMYKFKSKSHSFFKIGVLKEVGEKIERLNNQNIFCHQPLEGVGSLLEISSLARSLASIEGA